MGNPTEISRISILSGENWELHRQMMSTTLGTEQGGQVAMSIISAFTHPKYPSTKYPT